MSSVKDELHYLNTRAVRGGNIDPTFITGGKVNTILDAWGNDIETDTDVTANLVTIDAVHREIHEGEFFSTGYLVPHDSPVGDDASIDVAITTGVRYCHATAQGAFGGDFEGYLYEDADIDNDGVAIPIRNHKRVGGIGTSVTAVHSPTVNAVGTLLDAAFIPGGTGGNFSNGGTQSQRSEWILRPNTTYLYRLTNRAGSAQQGSLGILWYEVARN